MSKELREKATLAALNQGYSSLQESVRVFLTQLAEKKIETAFVPSIKLSVKAERRYSKVLDDIEKGKGISYTANSVEDLMNHLNNLK